MIVASFGLAPSTPEEVRLQYRTASNERQSGELTTLHPPPHKVVVVFVIAIGEWPTTSSSRSTSLSSSCPVTIRHRYRRSNDPLHLVVPILEFVTVAVAQSLTSEHPPSATSMTRSHRPLAVSILPPFVIAFVVPDVVSSSSSSFAPRRCAREESSSCETTRYAAVPPPSSSSSARIPAAGLHGAIDFVMAHARDRRDKSSDDPPVVVVAVIVIVVLPPSPSCSRWRVAPLPPPPPPLCPPPTLPPYTPHP